MPNKILFVFICLLFFSISISSQNITISGYVVDNNSGESLINANIVDSLGFSRGITNKFGFYSLKLKQNTRYNIRYSYLGYKLASINFTPHNDTVINVKLLPGTVLAEVTVYSSNERKIEERAEISKINIPLEIIKSIPSITGESDILKAFQLMPGVQSGSEGNNGLFVRGGTPDQNLFLLDDVPLYNVSHLGGLYSVFDASILKSVDLYKGGFPARYGGRISSVVDVRNKDGNLYLYKGEIGFSLFLSKLFIEGPIQKGKSSFAFSIRRSNLDGYSFLYDKLASKSYSQGYTFYDINIKSNFKLSQTNRLFMSVYQGRDNYYFKESEVTVAKSNLKYSDLSDLKWGNSVASIRWLHVFNSKVFNNLTLAYTKYIYKNYNSSSTTDLSDNSVQTDEYSLLSIVNDAIIKTDAEIPLNQNRIRIGGNYTKHFFVPSFVSYSRKISLNGSDSLLIPPKQKTMLNSDELYGYAELLYDIGDKLSGNAGFRAGYYLIGPTKFASFEPRIIMNYMFLPSFSFKASFCSMDQNMHLLTNSNTGLPSDAWIPSTALLKPESSQQITIGVAHTTNQNYEFTLESYYKKINNLIEYKEGVLIYSSSLNWDNKLEVGGTGIIKGAELLLSKKKGILTGWIGYTISENQRKFENINNGKAFPFTYDQRHNISIVCNYKLSETLSLSGTWVFHTGNSITLPSGKYQLYNIDYSDYGMQNFKDGVTYADVHIYSERNGYRMPNYHRLDFGLNYSRIKNKGTANWIFGVYNAYNRQNPYYVFFEKASNGTAKLYQKSLFPFLLNFGYSYSF